MDEKQLQEAIDGMISQRPQLVVERPREVRQGMGLFEASQDLGLSESVSQKNAKDIVKRLNKLASQTSNMYSDFREIEGALTMLTGYGQKEFVETSGLVRQAKKLSEDLRKALSDASDVAAKGLKTLK